MIKDLQSRISSFLFVFLLCAGVFIYLKHEKVEISLDTFTNNDLKRVFARNALEDEARQLVKIGDYDAAILKYQEATLPDYLNRESDKWSSLSDIKKIYLAMHRYDEALKLMEWFYRNGKNAEPTEFVIEDKKEVDALKKFYLTGNATTVYKFIETFVAENKARLPPLDFGNTVAISRVLWLYNTIGDHDSGIKFINDILTWTFDADEQFKHLKGVVKTSEQAVRCAKFDGDSKSDWRECKWLREYLLVREAFEQDKRDGFKGCAHSPPGQVCMGKATKALIQSDYFPW